MKKLFLFFIFLFLVSSVSAYYAGEEIVLKHLDKCNSINVFVSGDQEINKGEYFLKNCERVNENEWFCNCSDNYDLILQTNIRTINNYTVNIFYDYSIEGLGSDSIIKVSGDDVVLNEVSYENGILKINATSSGLKTIKIDVSAFGKPNQLYVDDVLIDNWTYDNGIITLTLQFSTRTLKLDYNIVIQGGGSPGGSPGGKEYSNILPIEEKKIEIERECAKDYVLNERLDCVKISEEKMETQEQ